MASRFRSALLLALLAAALVYVGCTSASPPPVEQPDPLLGAHPLSAVSIDFAHDELHEGSSYSVDYSETTASSDDDRTIIGLTTSNTAKWNHVVITITASGAAEFFIYEAPTFTAGQGTDGAIYNRQRNSSKASTTLNQDAAPERGKVSTYDEAEAVNLNYSGGTLIDYQLMASGTGPKPVGGTSRGVQEWVLKQNTSYLFIVQNVGASANTHVINLSWYEHSF